MATILDVSRYIAMNNGPMTTMKLQKLVYYCQAWHLAWEDKPLFTEDFEAWANGPVSPQLFSYHKGMFTVDKDFLADYSKGKLSTEEREIVDGIIAFYGDKDPHWLSELTHMERPWKESRGSCSPGEFCNTTIPKELMQEYYSGLK